MGLCAWPYKQLICFLLKWSYDFCKLITAPFASTAKELRVKFINESMLLLKSLYALLNSKFSMSLLLSSVFFMALVLQFMHIFLGFVYITERYPKTFCKKKMGSS